MSLSIDLKYTVRSLLKKPMFTCLTVLIVAIGLGLTLFTYSLLSNLVFKPMTLNGDSEIIAVEGRFDHNHLFRLGVDPLHLLQAERETGLFEQLGFYFDGITFIGGSGVTNGDLAIARKANSVYTSWNIFELTGTQPVHGRGFSPQDYNPGAEPVVVLGYDVWQHYFNGNPAIVGSMVPLDSVPTRIIGVMPPDFAFPESAEIWQPLPANAVAPTQASWATVYGFARLKKGASLTQLNDALKGINKEIAATLDDRFSRRIGDNGLYLRALPYKEASIIQYYHIFVALLIVVFLILMLACINVGNLLLARVNERFKEIAIRVALGVPRKRLVLQMLSESIFICVLGGFIAVLFASYGLEVANRVMDVTFAVNHGKPFWWHLSLDVDAIWLLLFAVLAMILITGLIPAIKALNGDFNAVIRDGTRGSLGQKAARASKILVISEILLSCVVLVMATLLLCTGYAAARADYGVDTTNRLTAQIQLPPDKFKLRRNSEFEYQDRIARSTAFYKIKAALEAMPNIEATAFMTQLPGSGEGTSYFEIEGRPARVYNENPYSNNEVVLRDSWRAIGMKVVQGRDFDQRDAAESARSIVVNESIARDFFPQGDAVGKRVRRVSRDGHGDDWYTIVGVVSDTFHGSTMSSSSTAYNTYHALDNIGGIRLYVALHYTGKAASAQKALLQAVQDVDADIGVFHVQPYDKMIQQPMLLVLAVSKIFLICGIVAALLAASGIYAVAANSVTQRTQEIGVRRALGCSDNGIIRLFMKQALLQLTIGLAIGISLSVLLADYMSNTIVINHGSYLLGMVGVPLLILAMVMLATLLPAKAVIKLEPSDALHHD